MRFFKIPEGFSCHQSGTTLLETVVALAVLGTIAVTFLTGVAISSKAVFSTDTRATAESLAQTQMEWVQNSSYNATGYPSTAIPDGKDYVNYSANITTQSLDTNIQKITVTVLFSNQQIFTLEGYKVNR